MEASNEDNARRKEECLEDIKANQDDLLRQLDDLLDYLGEDAPGYGDSQDQPDPDPIPESAKDFELPETEPEPIFDVEVLESESDSEPEPELDPVPVPVSKAQPPQEPEPVPVDFKPPESDDFFESLGLEENADMDSGDEDLPENLPGFLSNIK